MKRRPPNSTLFPYPTLSRSLSGVGGAREDGPTAGRPPGAAAPRAALFSHSEKRAARGAAARSEEHTSELQSRPHLPRRLLLGQNKQLPEVLTNSDKWS